MAAIITGYVFHDTNHNGQYSEDKPGIPDVTVILYHADTGCISTRTDSNGSYDFSISAPGIYTVYETVTDSENACPPGSFTQPVGFSLSNGPRKQTITITETQIGSAETISSINFSHDNLSSPFSCESGMILFTGRPTILYHVNPVSGQADNLGTLTPADDVNAIGFHIQDYFIYGYDQTADTIVRADQNGTLAFLGPRPTGLPAADYTVGTVDVNGFYYLYVTGTNRFYTIDLQENSATFLKLVDPAQGFEEQTASFGTPLTSPLSIGDWAFNPMDGYLYGVDIYGIVQRISPGDGTVTPLSTNGPNPGNIFGAVTIDAAGTLFAVSDSDGTLYKYTISGDTATGVRFASTVYDDFTDAAMCPFQRILVDYGDAPDAGGGGGSGSYNTLLANNGPRHGLISPLYLGVTVTAEEDAHQNATATGDDLTQGIQDDGLPEYLPPLSPGDRSYTLPVTVTNQTPDSAYLYAWIDYNKNGLFEAEEALPVTLIPPFTSQLYSLVSNIPQSVVLTPGHTFLRLRLTTDTLIDTGAELQDTRSVGPASDGEVEDYILKIGTITDLLIQKTADLQVLQTGDTITYTLTIDNIGTEPALETVVTDVVPPELTNPLFSLDGGQSWDYWSGALSLGTVNAGQSVSILIQGTFDSSVIGPVVNTATVTTTSDDPNPCNNSSTVTTPVTRSADLSVHKTADLQTALAGELLTYQIQIENAGPDTAVKTTITDAVPAQLLDPFYSTDLGQVWYPWTGQLTLGDMPSHAAELLFIRGMVDPSASGTIRNTAEVISDTDDPNPDDNRSEIDLPIDASADLSITKSGAPDPAGIGQKVIYTILVSNSGPADARDVTLTETLPSTLSNLEYSTDNGITWNLWSTPYEIGTLEPNANYSLLLMATVTASVPGPISNTITVSSSTTDSEPDNNSYTAEVEAVPTADLAVVKTADQASVISGDLLTYRIAITNNGPFQADQVSLADDIPAGLSNPEFSLDETTWTPWVSPAFLGAMPNGSTITVWIRGIAAADVSGNLVNTATVSSDQPDPVPDNNSSTVTTPVSASADLMVTKTASAASITSGESLTYTITVTNNGPSNTQDAAITDTIPPELEDAEFSLDGGTSWQPWTGSAELGALSSESSIVCFIRGMVSTAATGVIANTAIITSTTPDPDPDDNIVTEYVTVQNQADLSILKTASHLTVRPCTPICYTLTVTNHGPAAAEHVVLSDKAAHADYSDDGGITWYPWNGSYNIGTMSQGQTIILLLRTMADRNAAGVITNTGTVSSSTPDPYPDNNTSTVVIPVEQAAHLKLTKAACPDIVRPCQRLLYRMCVINHGPDSAQDVVLTDYVPDCLYNVQYSTNQGRTWRPWEGALCIGTLSTGTCATILISGFVDRCASGVITNQATVTASTPDPDPCENTAAAVVCIRPECC